jgi:hypothetical protein
MLSNNLRLKIQTIADKIAKGEPVSLKEMTFATKVAKANHSAAEILNKARRVAFQGEPEENSLDELLQGLNLGIPDPSSHITQESTIDDLANFFTRESPEDWRQRD